MTYEIFNEYIEQILSMNGVDEVDRELRKKTLEFLDRLVKYEGVERYSETAKEDEYA